MKNLSEYITEAQGMTYCVSDNIDGKTWKVAVYVKNTKEEGTLDELMYKGGVRRFNSEVYCDGREKEVEGYGKALSLKEFEDKLKNGELK